MIDFILTHGAHIAALAVGISISRWLIAQADARRAARPQPGARQDQRMPGWAANVTVSGTQVWSCIHEHATVDDAFECAESQIRAGVR